MKKKISLLLCVLIAALSFAGCGSSADGFSKEDKENAKVVSQTMVQMFTSMDEEGAQSILDMSDYELNYQLMAMSYSNQQSGYPELKVDSEVFRKMINAWFAGIDECGAYSECGDFSVEEKSSSIVVSASAKYADREATISFTFDEKMSIDSFDVAAKYTTGEILTKAGLNTLLGMGTVFAVLIFLAFIIYLMKFIPMFMDKLQKKSTAAPATEAPAAPVAPVVVDETDDLELVAVISAAIAASEGTSTDGFVVRSIKRRTSNNWN